AFKNSLAADEVASAIREGLDKSRLRCTTVSFPVADGGDGTRALLLKKLGGIDLVTAVHDALGRPVNASMGFIDNGDTAVIEMADASGLRLLKKNELDPLKAVSFGTGEQVKRALDHKVKKIILAMGGSATVDGGTGILSALGIRFLNADGRELAVLPRDLVHLDHIDLSGLDQRIFACEVIVLCDVDNTLLGANGAAAVFGPQKGASPDDVIRLEQALTRFSAVASGTSGIAIAQLKHGGTAGGAAAGLYAFIKASFVNGIDYFLDLTGFDKALGTSDIVITGEGSVDEQTLQGKGPYGVAARAKQKGIPVIAMAGSVPLAENSRLSEYFDVLLSIGHEPASMEAALRDTRENLVRVSRQLGNLLLHFHITS
ncbi:MAG TPA: glycerate kinase, partial [Chitinophagaceae bacterium]